MTLTPVVREVVLVGTKGTECVLEVLKKFFRVSAHFVPAGTSIIRFDPATKPCEKAQRLAEEAVLAEENNHPPTSVIIGVSFVATDITEKKIIDLATIVDLQRFLNVFAGDDYHLVVGMALCSNGNMNAPETFSEELCVRVMLETDIDSISIVKSELAISGPSEPFSGYFSELLESPEDDVELICARILERLRKMDEIGCLIAPNQKLPDVESVKERVIR